MKKTVFTLLYVLAVYALFQGCKKTTDTETGQANSVYIAAADCTGSTPTYTKDVKPIFDAKCATSGCHGATNPAHGLNLTTFDLAKRDFNVHALLCSINWGSGCSKMPNNGTKLSAAEIKSITCWAKNSFPQ